MILSCHKEWDRRGGRDLTGSPKLLSGKCRANKLLQVINTGHEAIFVLGLAFNILHKCENLFVSYNLDAK